MPFVDDDAKPRCDHSAGGDTFTKSREVCCRFTMGQRFRPSLQKVVFRLWLLFRSYYVLKYNVFCAVYLALL